MLTIEHKAIHLYREDAYRDYCIGVDVYGAYQPASFIYLCFEAFKDACAEQGLSLVKLPKPPTQYENKMKDFPWRHERDVIPDHIEPRGLILRINSDEDVIVAQEALHRGRNVLALIPSGAITIWEHSPIEQREEMQQKSEVAAMKLGISGEDWKIAINFSWKQNIHWKEIDVGTAGRLFVIHDFFISDGYFLENYGFSLENHRKIQSLIESFACFKTNLLRLSYRNVVKSWPTGEPLTIIIDIVNHGPNCGEVTLRMEIGPEFEAISPLERKIRSLQSLERTSFALQLVPRVDGSFPMVVGASASLENGSSCTVHSNQLDLTVRPALNSSQRSSAPQDDETLSRLIKVFQVFHDENMRAEVEALPELARIDARSCLNRIRTVTERIVFNYIDSHDINCRERTLDVAIRALRNHSPFSNRTIGYLHTIRVIGNLGSHATDDPLTDVDVRILSYALASVVEDFMEQNGL